MIFPDWVVQAARERGGEPTPLREVNAAVFVCGQWIGKLHVRQTPAEVANEVRCASAAAAAHVGVGPVDVQTGPDGTTLSWWPRMATVGVDQPYRLVNTLRILHDSVCTAPGERKAAIHDAHAHPTYAGGEKLAKQLRPMLHDAAQRWDECDQHQVGGGAVLIHADPNPTNVAVGAAGQLLLLDFGSAGVGLRAYDVAYVGVMAEETGSGVFAQVCAAYGEHPHVSASALSAAAHHIAIRRAWACVWMPSWEGEGWARIAAARAGEFYRFGDGEGPK